MLGVTPVAPHGQGFIAATSMNCVGKITVPAARAMVTFPSSNDWRMTSRVDRLNSGNSATTQHAPFAMFPRGRWMTT